MGSNQLRVSPMSRRNGQTLIWSGVGLFILGLLLWSLASFLFAPAMVCLVFAVFLLIIGMGKVWEPHTSLILEKEGLLYVHRKGQVSIAWENIQRVDIPRVTQGFDLISLPYVGFKIKQINPILDTISPRLATGLLTEQRPLLMTALSGEEGASIGGFSEYLSQEFTPLLVNNERYRGLLAMFGHRCMTLNEHLGYHLYIPKDSLDREPEEFIALLRKYMVGRD